MVELMDRLVDQFHIDPNSIIGEFAMKLSEKMDLTLLITSSLAQEKKIAFIIDMVDQ